MQRNYNSLATHLAFDKYIHYCNHQKKNMQFILHLLNVERKDKCQFLANALINFLQNAVVNKCFIYQMLFIICCISQTMLSCLLKI